MELFLYRVGEDVSSEQRNAVDANFDKSGNVGLDREVGQSNHVVLTVLPHVQIHSFWD